MKAVIMAGGSGSRLYPSSFSFTKHLLPIFDKPMIYYPLSVLMLAGIRDVLIVVSPENIFLYKKLLSNGENFGINIKYAIQKNHNGIGEVFSISKKFVNKDRFCVILGDNFFWGDGLFDKLKLAKNSKKKNVLFSYNVNNPNEFAVLSKKNNKYIIQEKPTKAKSKTIITGLYFYNNEVFSVAKNLKPSKRGELEISDINNYFCRNNDTEIIELGRGFAWYDCGSNKNIHEASLFVQTIEKRQGYKIACLEEIAYLKKWINKARIKSIVKRYNFNDYAKYLIDII